MHFIYLLLTLLIRVCCFVSFAFAFPSPLFPRAMSYLLVVCVAPFVIFNYIGECSLSSAVKISLTFS